MCEGLLEGLGLGVFRWEEEWDACFRAFSADSSFRGDVYVSAGGMLSS